LLIGSAGRLVALTPLTIHFKLTAFLYYWMIEAKDYLAACPALFASFLIDTNRRGDTKVRKVYVGGSNKSPCVVTPDGNVFAAQHTRLTCMISFLY